MRAGPPGWGLDVGLTTPNQKNKFVTKSHKEPWTETDSFINDLIDEIWTC
jgi:hypothetical protein